VACVWLAATLVRADQPGTPDRTETLRQVAGILDYIAGDYRGAVNAQGTVQSAGEYAEQRALAKDAVALVTQVGIAAGDPLQISLAALTQALDAHRAPAQVEPLCRDARTAIVDSHHVDLTPASAPARELAERLYTTQTCVTCHAADGGAQTPAAAALDPRPANFLDAERMATVSPHRAFHAITFGVPGTGMRAFPALSDAERWSLAFYVLSLRHLRADVGAGRVAFESARRPAPEDARGLSSLTEEQLDQRLAAIADARVRADALGYLRAEAPFAQSARALGFSRAYQQLDAGLAAYRQGDKDQALRAFISAYLDGVEPHEASLRARDSALVGELEAAMLALRSAASMGLPEPQLTAAVAQARKLLDRAQETKADAGTALIGAMTITLREGVEIVLLVAALLGLVRKRGHPELARYVHAGWMLAVPAGLATFYAAESALSGMQRELAEGLASLLAAFVLLGVTHWLLGQLGAKRWAGFLARRIAAATSGPRAALGVLGLAFLAAYREAFEIVLFFQALVRDAGSATREVWLGAALGLGLLCIVALFMLRVGRRLKPAPFMLASSIFLAALTFVMVGKGVHALQEAAVLPINALGWSGLPAIGLYANWEGLAAQALLLIALLASALAPLRAARADRRGGASGNAAPAE
jgi:high-affinity iron transporter